MAASQLEQMRLLHEELEALENHVVEVFETKPDAVSILRESTSCSTAIPTVGMPELLDAA